MWAMGLLLWVLPLPAMAGARSALPPGVLEDVLICGALLAMGFYHLVIFALQRSTHSALWLSGYCLLRAFYSLSAQQHGQSLTLFIPGLDANAALSASFVSLTLSSLCLQTFLHTVFARQFPRAGVIGLSAAGCLCLAAGLLTGGFNGPVLHAQMLFITVVALYSLANLARAARARESGAIVLLAGYAALAICGIADVLQGEALFSGLRLAPIGSLAFVFAQSALLAHRFAQASAARQRLSEQMERQNARLEQEIARRGRLQRKLDTVSDEERRFVSRALHDGLCQELTAARLHCSLGRTSTTDGAAAFGKVSELLEHAVDQAYELSRGLWPVGQTIADLPCALRDLADVVSAEQGLPVSLHCELGGLALDAAQNERIYLIIKEALKNVEKHAHARRVSVELSSTDEAWLRLVVDDDGIGLQASETRRDGLGSRIMAHHAQSLGGSLTLKPGPAGGTRVELILPNPEGEVCPGNPAHDIPP